jgi:suppressor of fused protein SUFU
MPQDNGELVVELVRTALLERFAAVPSSASVSFVGVEPIEVLRFHGGDLVEYVTLGMCRRPLPEQSAEAGVSSAPSVGPRGELRMSVRSGFGSADVWRRLAVLAAAPAVEGLRYADGAIVSLGEPLVSGARAHGVVVGESDIVVDTAAGAVTVFDVLPATPDELAWSRVNGVAALRERWREQGTDLTDLGRAPAHLG